MLSLLLLFVAAGNELLCMEARGVKRRISDFTSSSDVDESGQEMEEREFQQELEEGERRKMLILGAAQEGSTRIVNEVLKEDSNLIYAINELEQTPLHIAAEYGHADLLELLLPQSGMLLAALDAEGYSPLMHAVAGNHTVAVGVLMDYYNRDREMYENNIIVAASMLPGMVDGQDNPYYAEIYDTLMNETTSLSAEESKENIMRTIQQLQGDIGCLQNDTRRVRPTSRTSSRKKKIKLLPKDLLDTKNLSWLRAHVGKLIVRRDTLSQEIAPTRQADEFVQMTCFACCLVGSKLSLLNVPCKDRCSGSEQWICTACFPSLGVECPFCRG